MPVDLAHPDLATSIPLGPFAARDARYRVAAMADHPSPDLRDAITLLTSELVTRAISQAASTPGSQSAELRAWMLGDVIRVELTPPPGVDITPRADGSCDYELMLLDQVADRWSGEDAPECTCVWFEIDRSH